MAALGRSSRSKGQGGERELAALLTELTGFEIKRRCRQHRADSDLEGLPGWSVECKRHRSAGQGLIESWWAQTVMQAMAARDRPVLFYRLDRAGWRAVWSADQSDLEFDAALTSSPSTWWSMQQLGP